MNGDYSVTPGVFYVHPPVGRVYLINRLIFQLECGPVLSTSGYGNGATLPNGILMQIEDASDDSVIVDLLGGEPIQSNSHWARYSYDTSWDRYVTGNYVVNTRVTFERFGYPIQVLQSQRLVVRVSDDLSGLVSHTFLFEGLNLSGPITTSNASDFIPSDDY